MIESASIETPQYRNPPVVEVLLSIAFDPIQQLGVIAIADLWREHFSELRDVEEQPPLEMAVERFDTPGDPVSFEFRSTLPLPRLWFQNESRTQLVQVQNNFLARNWRKNEGSADYPRYPALRKLFAADLAHLQEFLAARNLGKLIPTQCELTYVNHVPRAKVTDVLSFVTGDRTLGDPDATSVAMQYIIRDADKPIGRLHLQAASARSKSTGEPLVVLNLTARGRPLGPGVDGVFGFLDLGRVWTRRAFETGTRHELKKEWGKTDA